MERTYVGKLTIKAHAVLVGRSDVVDELKDYLGEFMVLTVTGCVGYGIHPPQYRMPSEAQS